MRSVGLIALLSLAGGCGDGEDITDMKAQMYGLQLEIDSLKEQMDDGLSSVATFQNDLDDLDAMKLTVASLETTVAASSSAISGNEDAIEDLDTQVTANQSQLTSVEIDIASNTSTSNANSSEISTLQTDVTANTTAVDVNATAIATNVTNIGANTTDISTNASGVSINTADISINVADISANASGISTNATDISTNTSDHASTRTDLDSLTPLSAFLTVQGTDIIFEGANVNIRSGSGSTNDELDSGGSLTALGNLIIGYNENIAGDALRDGSHNLVLGQENTYSSYSGIVSGEGNTLTAPDAAIIGGISNIVSGQYAVAIAGSGNKSTGIASLTSAGGANTAEGDYSHVLGEESNTASSDYEIVPSLEVQTFP